MNITNAESELMKPDRLLRSGEMFAPILRLGEPDIKGALDRISRFLPDSAAHTDPAILKSGNLNFELVPGTRYAIDKGSLSSLTPDSSSRKIFKQGTFGVIIPGRDIRLNQEVIFKIFAPDMGIFNDKITTIDITQDEHNKSKMDYLARFYKEARMMAHIEHPHIAKVLDVSGFTMRNYFFPAIIMRKYEKSLVIRKGEELLDRQYERLSSRQLMRLAEQIGSALDHSHSLGILHCDVGPGNIFMNGNDSFFLGDFGIVKGDYRVQPYEPVGIGAGTLTAAPEQILQERYHLLSNATHQHQFATLLFIMLNGALRPFIDNLKYSSTVHNRESQRLNPQGIKPKVYEVLKKATSWEPQDRYGSCMELANAFIGAIK